MSAAILRELAYVRAVFQLRTLVAIIHDAPCGEHPQGEDAERLRAKPADAVAGASRTGAQP